jgi:hypothetical protein
MGGRRAEGGETHHQFIKYRHWPNITAVTEKWLERNGKFFHMTCLGTRRGVG